MTDRAAAPETGRRLAVAAAASYMGRVAHVHEHLAGTTLMEAARDVLTKAGEQWTPMRAQVLAALEEFERPASAYDLADSLSRAEGRRVPANSVYRILDVLVGADLVRRVESSNAFVVNAHPSCRHDCMFLICDSCGSVTHLDDDRLTRAFRSAAKLAGFEPRQPVLEMRGRCAGCA